MSIFTRALSLTFRDFTSSSSTANPIAAPLAAASPVLPAPSSPAAQTPVSSPARTGAAGVSLGAEAAVPPGKKVEIALNNGARFRGTVLTADERLVTLEVAGGSSVNFYRTVILDISDLSAIPPASSPIPAVPPVQTQTASSSPQMQPVPSVPMPPSSSVQAASAAPAAEVAVIPGKNIEITLKNGSKFKGTVLTADDRVITLEVARGSKIDFYKSVIISIKDLTAAPVVSTNQVSAPSPLQPPSTPSIGSIPAQPAAQITAPAPLAASPSQPVPPLKPAATVSANDALQKKSDTIAAMVTQKPVTQAPAAAQETPVMQTTATPAVVQPKPEEKNPVAAIQLPTPVLPQQQPTHAIEEWTPKNVPPSVPISPPPVPSVTLPAVQPVSTLAAAAPKKPEGKNELILKNGTILRGTILSESDRVLTFSTGDGVTVNILRRLIKTADGIPYAARSGALPAYADTFSQLRTTAPVAAAGPETVGTIAGLCKSLSDSSAESRKKAVIALGMIHDTAVVPALLTALKDNDASVRKLAAETLGDIRDPRAIQPLFAALQEPVDSVKAAVVFSLKLHTETPLLIGALDNQNSLVRDNVAYILFLITSKNIGNEKQAWVDWYAKGQ